MLKKTILLLLAVLAAATLAAAQGSESFLSFYWLSGSVSQEGSPAAGRLVRFYHTDPALSVTTETDANGYYSLNVFELEFFFGVPITFETETYHLDVPRSLGESYGTTEAIQLQNEAGFMTKDLAVLPGEGPYIGPPATIDGYVRSQAGAPLTGATVSLNTPQGIRTTTTDGSGYYIISDLAGGEYDVHAGANGFAPGTVNVEAVLGQTRSANFTLQPLGANEAVLWGLVADSSGQPLGGAVVAADSYRAITRTVDGYYELIVAPQSYNVSASLEPYTTSTESVTLTDQVSRNLNFQLTLLAPAQAGRLVGTVRDSAGAPIANALISTGSQTAVNLPNGSYAIESVPPGVYQVIASADNYQSKVVTAEVLAGSDTTLNFDLEALPAGTGDIWGYVRNDATGAGLVGATVTSGALSATAGAGGLYQLTSVPAGTYLLTAQQTAYLPASETVILAGNESVPRDFFLRYAPYGTVEGFVTSAATGAPIDGARITFEVGGIEQAVYSVGGVYTIESAAIGSRVFYCSAGGYFPSSETFTVLPSTVNTGFNFALSPRDYAGWAGPLAIRRAADAAGSNIEVTWDPAEYPNARLYYLTGDGSGVYTDEAAAWTLVVDGGEFNLNVNAGALLHNNQVGAGTAEAYYKLISSTGDHNLLLPPAQAVGKFNVMIYENSNLISLPLFNPNTGIDNVFGTQLTGGPNAAASDKIYYFDLSLDPDDWSIAWLSNNAGDEGWKGFLADLLPDRGYFVARTAGAGNKEITVVGDAAVNADRRINLKLGSNMIGSAYPRTIGLDSSNLLSVLKTDELAANADQIFEWSNPLNDWTISYASPTGFAGLLENFRPGKGYWVINSELADPPQDDEWIYYKP